MLFSNFGNLFLFWVLDLIIVEGFGMYDYYEVFYFVRCFIIDLDYDNLIYIMTFETSVLFVLQSFQQFLFVLPLFEK